MLLHPRWRRVVAWPRRVKICAGTRWLVLATAYNKDGVPYGAHDPQLGRPNLPVGARSTGASHGRPVEQAVAGVADGYAAARIGWRVCACTSAGLSPTACVAFPATSARRMAPPAWRSPAPPALDPTPTPVAASALRTAPRTPGKPIYATILPAVDWPAVGWPKERSGKRGRHAYGMPTCKNVASSSPIG